MEDFYENALIKLRHKYDKDELVNSLITENEKLKLQIDEKDEFKYNVDKYIRQGINKKINIQHE